MTAQVLDGAATARALFAEIAPEVAAFTAAQGYPPALTVVQAGADPASDVYVKQIERSVGRVGIAVARHALPADVTLDALTAVIRALNAEPRTHGILLQMPLPAHLPQALVVDALDPGKDVDGIHPLNAGRLLQNLSGRLDPATPSGGMELLLRYGIPLEGRRAVVVGRSNVVGRPMALLLLHANATVTVCHSRTPDLADVCRQADILVAAVGRPRLITADMIRPGAVVVDFGVNVVDGRLMGDVDADAVRGVAGWLTPVPGGTGPMTNAMLARNVLAAARRQTAGRLS